MSSEERRAMIAQWQDPPQAQPVAQEEAKQEEKEKPTPQQQEATPEPTQG